MVTVERVGPQQWARVRTIRLRALRDAPNAFWSTLAQEEALDDAGWRARLGRGDAVTQLAVDAGDDVGMAVGAAHHDRPADAGLCAASIGVMMRSSEAAALSVCVYCSSSDRVSDDLRGLAEAVGTGLGARGWTMVYGGGAVGLMGVAARSALAAGARVIGVIPEKLVDREVALDEVTELIRTQTMRERKQVMDERSDAFLILPGGIGTLEELTEMVSLRQLGYHDRPIVLLDADGFWAPLQALMAQMADHGMLHVPIERLWTYARSVDTALSALNGAASEGADR